MEKASASMGVLCQDGHVSSDQVAVDCLVLGGVSSEQRVAQCGVSFEHDGVACSGHAWMTGACHRLD